MPTPPPCNFKLGNNLRTELADIVTEILNTREEGFEYGGQTRKVEWFQSMDLSSFWKQTGLHYNAKVGFCAFCSCNFTNHFDFEKWGAVRLDSDMHYTPILPIDKAHTCFCCMHGKVRCCEKLLTLAAASSKKAGQLANFTKAIREQCGVTCFNTTVLDDNSSVSISSLCGFNCDRIMDGIDFVLPYFGEADYVRTAESIFHYGPDDLDSKTGGQIKKWLLAKACLAMIVLHSI